LLLTGYLLPCLLLHGLLLCALLLHGLLLCLLHGLLHYRALIWR
jgi:hypothetical protein